MIRWTECLQSSATLTASKSAHDLVSWFSICFQVIDSSKLLVEPTWMDVKTCQNLLCIWISHCASLIQRQWRWNIFICCNYGSSAHDIGRVARTVLLLWLYRVVRPGNGLTTRKKTLPSWISCGVNLKSYIPLQNAAVNLYPNSGN